MPELYKTLVIIIIFPLVYFNRQCNNQIKITPELNDTERNDIEENVADGFTSSIFCAGEANFV